MPRPHVAGRPAARIASLVVALVVLAPVAVAAAPVEDFSTYQPQTKCNPKAKSGTLQLAAWLQRKYKGTGSLGISRACGHGGVSEHKEGRAFDWAINATSARDRKYAADFLSTIFATDRNGNVAAKARRMGIMYLIWNDHIYSSGRSFAKTPYLSSSCKRKRINKCPATLRHRDHMHISLSKAGGRGDTSWYHRKDPNWSPPSPVVKPEPTPPVTEPTPPPPTLEPARTLNLTRRPYARVRVPADGSTVRTKFAVEAGATYKLTAAGLFTFGAPDQVGDAVCAWSRSSRDWAASPDKAAARRHGSLDLKVNGASLFGTECHGRSHTYRTTFTPTRTKALRLRIANRSGADAKGGLWLTVSKRRTDIRTVLPTYPDLTAPPAVPTDAPRGYGVLSETVSVPASSSRGVLTRQELQEGARYRLTVSGVVGLGQGAQSNGQCVSLGSGWYPQASLDRRFPDQDHGNLYVDGVPFAGRSTGEGCESHSHTTTFTATRTARLRLALWDPKGHSGNTGSLTVLVQRLTRLEVPTEAKQRKPRKSEAWTQRREWLPLTTTSRAGTVSGLRLRRGEKVLVVVRGTHSSHGVEADATCVRTAAGWLPQDPTVGLRQDPLELWVDGRPATWRALGKKDGCSTEHAYATTYTARKSGPIRLAVLDLDYGDNRSSMSVTLLRQR